jgi:hypothetical protein
MEMIRMYEAIKSLIDKLDKIIDWAENVTCENKNEEFYVDMVQTRLDETKEECIFMLKILDK